MRYHEYLKQVKQLDKGIAACLEREIKAANGTGPWYVRLFPSFRNSTIEVANRKRGALARQRAKLVRQMFADPSTVWNVDAAAVFRRTVPSSPEAVEHLRNAAAADFQK